MYKIWVDVQIQDLPPQIAITKIELNDRILMYNTNRGESLLKPLPPITFTVDTLAGFHGVDSLWGGIPYQVFSIKLRTVLTKVEAKNVAYYPALIKTREGNNSLKDYQIANIIGKVDCIDHQRSEIEYDTNFKNKIRRIRRLVINYSSIPEDLQLFRLKEIPSIILSSGSVQENIIKSEVVGVKFIDIKDFFLG